MNTYMNNQGYYYGMPPELYYRRNEEKKSLGFLSRCAGLSLVSYVVLQNIFGTIIVIPTLKNLYYSDALFFYSFNILLSVASILLPFLVMGRLESRRMPDIELLPLGKPEKPSLIFLALPIGLTCCLAGNYATGLLQSFLSNFGVKLSSPELTQPTDAMGMAVYFLYVSIGAALIEETVIRGIVMQPLRRHGNGFAVVMSALTFGIMHCNLIQAPFAFIAGLGMGYFAIATESLWTAILIHFCNNAYSIIISQLNDRLPQSTFLVVYYVLTGAIVVSGIICLLVFMRVRGSLSLSKTQSALNRAEKTRAYVLSLPMVIAIIMMLIITAQFITRQ